MDWSLERALRDLVVRTSRAWPKLALPPEELVPHAAWHLPKLVDGPEVCEALSKLHAEDLYLACACALSVPGAIQAFDTTFFGPGLGRLLSRFDPSASFVDEVRQALREKRFYSSLSAHLIRTSGDGFAHPLVADPQESHWLSIGGVGHRAAAGGFQIAGLSAFFGAPLSLHLSGATWFAHIVHLVPETGIRCTIKSEIDDSARGPASNMD